MDAVYYCMYIAWKKNHQIPLQVLKITLWSSTRIPTKPNVRRIRLMSHKSWLSRWLQTYTNLTASPQTWNSMSVALRNYSNTFYSSYRHYQSGILNFRLGFAVSNHDWEGCSTSWRENVPTCPHPPRNCGTSMLLLKRGNVFCTKCNKMYFVIWEQNLKENSFLLSARVYRNHTRHEYKTIEPRLTL